MAQGFFDERREQSQIKAEIVQKYFFAWANVVGVAARMRGSNIAYIDLFAGPGRYKDGSASVPVMLLERAVDDEFLCQSLATIFNDLDMENVEALQAEIDAIKGIEKLRVKPKIYHGEVGDEIVKAFEETRLVPTLFFVDPWGYKGLSLRLINSVLKDWGCDCVFFFNYNRVNMGVNNAAVEKHMIALFGDERFAELKKSCTDKSPEVRELLIIEKLTEALNEMGGGYVLPFNFKNEKGERTSHYLIFVSKHIRGYGIMKEVMWRYSSEKVDGIGSFSYCPAVPETPLLFEFARPLSDLKKLLLLKFAGRELTVQEIYEQHNVGTPYIKKNYKTALMELENDGLIKTAPSAEDRRRGTMADHVRCAFDG